MLLPRVQESDVSSLYLAAFNEHLAVPGMRKGVENKTHVMRHS